VTAGVDDADDDADLDVDTEADDGGGGDCDDGEYDDNDCDGDDTYTDGDYDDDDHDDEHYSLYDDNGGGCDENANRYNKCTTANNLTMTLIMAHTIRLRSLASHSQ
jgi:hypothetical protein